MLVVGMVVSVAAGSLAGLVGLLCGVGGFYVLTHQESIKVPFIKEAEKPKKTKGEAGRKTA